MNSRHHIFNFHIGFWGALLISAIVTIQTGVLLLMTSGFILAQTAPITLNNPSADIQLLVNDPLQLQATVNPSTFNVVKFVVTDTATGQATQFAGGSDDGGFTWGYEFNSSTPGSFSVVATVINNLGQYHDTSANPITISFINPIILDMVSPQDLETISDVKFFIVNTSSPVDSLKFELTLQGSTNTQILKATPTDASNSRFEYQFDTSTVQEGTYNLVPVAILGGSEFPGDPISINVQAPAQDTIDITSPASEAILSGPVTFLANSSADSTEVKFQITDASNNLVSTINADPVPGSTTQFTANFDTTTIPNTGAQPYALSVSGTIGGNIIPSPSISIFINNAAVNTPPVITTTTLPDGAVGASYSETIIATQGTPPYTYSLSNGLLPTGLSINGTSGVISGTPITASGHSFTIVVTDSAGKSATQSYGLNIAQAPANTPLAILSSNIADTTIAQQVTWTIQGTGGTAPYSWSVIAGSLPSGMQLTESTNKALIIGTPDTPGPITFTLQLKDEDNNVVQQSFTATLNAPGDTTTPPPAEETDQETISLTIKEPINTQTVSGNSLLVKVEATTKVNPPKISLINSSSGQNVILGSNDITAAPFGDASGMNWLLTLDTTKYPNGSYQLRATTTNPQTGGALTASIINFTISNGETLQAFSGTITSPGAGQTVAGNVPLVATLKGDVKSLMFIIKLPDGSTKQIAGLPNSTGGFEAIWDSAGVAGGTVTIKAQVIDNQNVTKGLNTVVVNLRAIKVTESAPDQVVDPTLVTNLQAGVISEVPVECQLAEVLDPAKCNSYLETRRIDILNEREQEVLREEQLPEIISRHIDLEDGKATQSQDGSVIEDPLAGIIPLDKNGTEKISVLVLGSTEPPASLKPFVQQTVPAVILFDQDGDGLPDEMEIRYGTNPQLADTDGDGFDDAMEIKNGFNPNGPGKLGRELAPVERAILNKLPLDQPRFAGAIDAEELEVSEIKTESVGENNKLRITGRAKANSVVTLYIYSQLPIVVTTQTDAAGNWVYEMDDPLVDGQHEVYVAVTNETGRIEKKSRPLSFFVDSAFAVSEEEFLASSPTVTDNTSKFLMWYIIGGILAISLGGFLFFFYFRTRVVISE